MGKNKLSNLELSGVSSKDFDGHTAFAEMTAEERLLWLSHAAEFVRQAGDLKREPKVKR